MKNWFAVGLAMAVSACTGAQVETYREDKPAFNLRKFFDRPVQGWGIFQDRSGKVVRRFKVDIRPVWSAESGTLDETFTWADGSSSTRVWTLRETAAGKFLGRADDVVGEATGEVSGNALRWRYVLALDVDGRT